MDEQKIEHYGDELYGALRGRRMISPLTAREPELTIDDAYRISRRLLQRRLDSGETVVGKKIGVTSKAVQKMLDVYQPDFGYLTSRMLYETGAQMPISRELIQPRAEGEIAFRLRRDLVGPGVTAEDVLDAAESVIACIEVVDSRIQDWNIRIQDTIADNASSGLFVLGREAVDPRRVDLATCGIVVEKNGKICSTGAGAEALGSPVHCVMWLANTLGGFGVPLKAGEIILSGSLVPLEPVQAGDRMNVVIAGIGSVSVWFT